MLANFHCCIAISFLFVMFATLPRSFFGLVCLVCLVRAYNTLPNVFFIYLDRFSLIFIILFRAYFYRLLHECISYCL